MRHVRQCAQRISTLEKASLFPCPRRRAEGGLPQRNVSVAVSRESKTTDFWCATLDMFNAKTVVDFSPGTGALACASMSRGVKYLGE